MNVHAQEKPVLLNVGAILKCEYCEGKLYQCFQTYILCSNKMYNPFQFVSTQNKAILSI